MVTRQLLRAYISAAVDDTDLRDTLVTERNTLARELLTNPDSGSELTTGSGNGLNFTAQVNFTKTQRLEFLEHVITAIDNGQPPPSRVYGVFI